SLALYKQIDAKLGIAKCLVGWAHVLLAQGEAERAAHFVSKAAALCKATGISPQATVSQRLEQTKCAIQETLRKEAFQIAWEQGEQMPIDDFLSTSKTDSMPQSEQE
ncbi:MAG TPA: hypothetical protein VKB76_01565, partial [Ktedonobacterales bacterium]|nr:hypothetical protein [Ktedonobacterales bacterium]